ncbi:hypothetical protein BS47DRAFT_1352087 [Hydnum rufescens UP504]|uniref:Rpr2-domain-containing protein n=1 Tax=Hydnum rufescens UP504 TaxID=1448309 RepID=A0A9P6AKQ5_9AGAM|nr:hypothetical protein BS47DRAFT_1352087 [Hydnum rufescens UP504]
MAKKSKSAVIPTASSVPNRDLMQRLNFLYQSSVYLEHLARSTDQPPASPGRDSLSRLSQAYVKSMRTIGKKALVRFDPVVKRSLCKGCDRVILAGTTASVRVKPSRTHGNRVVTTCLQCKTFRSIPHPPLIPPESGKEDTVQITHSPPLEGDASNENQSYMKSRRIRKRRCPPRTAIFSERDVGHIVYQGNQMLKPGNRR